MSITINTSEEFFQHLDEYHIPHANKVIVKGVHLRGNDFSSRTLDNIDFVDCTFYNVTFGKCRFVAFDSCSLESIQFEHNTTNLNFHKCKGDCLYFAQSDYHRDVNFEDCQVYRLRANGIALEDWEFSHSDVYYSGFTNSVFIQPIFKHAGFSECFFEGATFRSITLSGTTFQNCNLMRSSFARAALPFYSDFNFNPGCSLRWTIGCPTSNLRTCVLGQYIVTMYRGQDGTYTVAIGCQQHPWEYWLSVDRRLIALMDDGALEWYDAYIPMIQQIITLWDKESD